MMLSDYDKKNIQRNYKDIIKKIAENLKPYAFKSRGSTIVRVDGDIEKRIVFFRGKMPSLENFSFSVEWEVRWADRSRLFKGNFFSGRLNEFKPEQTSWFYITKNSTLENTSNFAKNISKILIEELLPFFDSFKTVEEVINLINNPPQNRVWSHPGNGIDKYSLISLLTYDACGKEKTLAYIHSVKEEIDDLISQEKSVSRQEFLRNWIEEKFSMIENIK